MLGVPRSGTTILARLLAQSPGARVWHEPNRRDFTEEIEAAKGQALDARVAYIRERDRKSRRNNGVVYGEVNPRLRYHSYALQEVFPDATVLALVRDGRDVVRSLLNYGYYQTTHRHRNIPLGGSTVFEKCCHLWVHGIWALRDLLAIRYEGWTTSYDSFRMVTDLLGLEIPEEKWRYVLTRRVNQGAGCYPRWHQWSRSDAEAFNRICGDVMDELYPEWENCP